MKKPILKQILTMATLGAVLGVTAGTAFSIPTYITNKQLQETEVQTTANATTSDVTTLTTSDGTTATTTSTSDSTEMTTNDASIEEIAANCLPSVVAITNKGVTEVQTMFGTYSEDSESCGSGIIIGQTDDELIIVTNYHVVADSNELTVVFSYDEDSEDPTAVEAKVKGYDEDKDIAVIAIDLDDLSSDTLSEIKVATIGDSSTLSLGEQVVAIGNALGYGQSVTTGIISALNREVTLTNDSGNEITNSLIQTDAAINPGNSGGALFNMKGELVGINSAKISSSSVEGMGYAIPISDVLDLIDELSLKETRDTVAEENQGYLGISGTDISSDIASTYDLPIGIYVSVVAEGSPAEEAGITKGVIITGFDGQTIKTMDELKSLIATYEAGETVTISAKVQSDNGYTDATFTVTLGQKETTTTTNSQNEQNSEEGQSQNPVQNFNQFFGMGR